MKEDVFGTMSAIARSCASDELIRALELSEKGLDDPTLRVGVFGTSPLMTKKALSSLLEPILKHDENEVLSFLERGSIVGEVWRKPFVVSRGDNEAFLCRGDIEMMTDGGVVECAPIVLEAPESVAQSSVEANNHDGEQDQGNIRR